MLMALFSGALSSSQGSKAGLLQLSQGNDIHCTAIEGCDVLSLQYQVSSVSHSSS